MKFVLAGALAIAICLLVGCASQLSKAMSQVDPSASIGSADAAATVRGIDLSARFPTTPKTFDQQSGRSDASTQPLLFPAADTQPPPLASSDPGSGQRTASLEPVVTRGDGIEMNFENAENHAVAKTLLDDILQLNFVVDPRVQDTVTLASVRPIARQDVLPAFESALRMQNAANVHEGKFVKIVLPS
jgi:general secretion pathway protein D